MFFVKCVINVFGSIRFTWSKTTLADLKATAKAVAL